MPDYTVQAGTHCCTHTFSITGSSRKDRLSAGFDGLRELGALRLMPLEYPIDVADADGYFCITITTAAVRCQALPEDPLVLQKTVELHAPI